jgi:hypothetical protein
VTGPTLGPTGAVGLTGPTGPTGPPPISTRIVTGIEDGAFYVIAWREATQHYESRADITLDREQARRVRDDLTAYLETLS